MDIARVSSWLGVVAISVMSTVPERAFGATVEGSATGGACAITINGEIDRSTLSQFQRALAHANVESKAQESLGGRCTLSLIVFNSPGGDVSAAMELGRDIRKAGAHTTVPRNGACASACVLAFVGGVFRTVDGRFGLHRPFAMSPSMTEPEALRKRQDVDRAISAYLSAMNLSDRLLQEMNAVSPGSMRWLSVSEVDQLQITGIDSVYEDVTDAWEAKRFGLSMQEYYARRQKTDSLCRWPLGGDEAAIRRYSQCRNDVMRGKW